MNALDLRLHACRPDLADIRMRQKFEARQYVEGKPAFVCCPVADLLHTPQDDADLDRQALYGEQVSVFDEADGYCWIQRQADNYVGYIKSRHLTNKATGGVDQAIPDHIVHVPRTILYSDSDLRSPRTMALSLGSRLVVVDHAETRGTHYAVLGNGNAVIAAHLREIDRPQPDYVSVAESLIFTPYLWGGNSAFGIDCSGLVQLAMMMNGKNVAAESDLQAQTIGQPVDISDRKFTNLQRGDLVFWKGHVGIMQDKGLLLHANGKTMSVASEPLKSAIKRIAYLYGLPTIVRRP